MTDKPKRPRDANQLAKFIVDMATDQAQDVVVDSEEVTLARSLAGKKGGKARAKSLPKVRREEIARLAAQSRWKENDS